MKHKALFLSFILLLSLLSGLFYSCSYTPRVQEHDIYEVKVKSSLNVREAPKSNARVIYRLQNGQKVEVMGIENNWAKIKMNHEYGYVSADYLVPYKLLPKVEEPEDIAMSDSTKTGGNTITKDGIVFNFVTRKSVAKEKVFQIARECHDSVIHSQRPAKNIFENIGEFITGAPENYTLVYVENCRLLTVAGSGKALTILKNRLGEDFYGPQVIALNNPAEGMYSMMNNIIAAQQYYNSQSWPVKWQIKFSSYFTAISEFIVENILPNDTFWYKGIASWLFFVPLRIAIFFTNLCHSIIGGFILVGLCYLLWVWFVSRDSIRKRLSKKPDRILFSVAGLLLLAIFFMTMVSFLIYLMPDYANVADMKLNGFSERDLAMLTKSYNEYDLSRSWGTIAVAITGWVLSIVIKGDLSIFNFLPGEEQQNILHQFPAEAWIAKYKLTPEIFQNISSENRPLSTLYFIIVLGRLRQTFVPLIISIFITDSYFLLYGTIFIWVIVLIRIIQLVNNLIHFSKTKQVMFF